MIPKHLTVDIAKEAIQQEHFEDYVMERVRSGECIFGLYPPDEDELARYRATRRTIVPIRIVNHN